jgi:hypothetical protein
LVLFNHHHGLFFNIAVVVFMYVPPPLLLFSRRFVSTDRFADNYISTTKYTVLNFLPVVCGSFVMCVCVCVCSICLNTGWFLFLVVVVGRSVLIFSQFPFFFFFFSSCHLDRTFVVRCGLNSSECLLFIVSVFSFSLTFPVLPSFPFKPTTQNLFLQFNKKANLYFLLVAIISCFPQISPKPWWVSVMPLVFVLAVSAIKEGTLGTHHFFSFLFFLFLLLPAFTTKREEKRTKILFCPHTDLNT